tara:strand:+ start:70 stop:468 length:399 start_codon:yes stop_codon:yes gene_type:complete
LIYITHGDFFLSLYSLLKSFLSLSVSKLFQNPSCLKAYNLFFLAKKLSGSCSQYVLSLSIFLIADLSIDKSAIKKIDNDNTYWEQDPLNFFAKKNKLYAFKHEGFWKSLDTLKDKNDFNKLYKDKKKSPWVI